MRLATSFVTACVISMFATLLLGARAGYADETLAARQQDFAVCARCRPMSLEASDAKTSLTGVDRRKSGGAVRYPHSAATVAANFTRDDATLDKFVAGRVDFVPVTSMFLSAPNRADRQNLIADLNAPKWSAQQDVAVLPEKPYRSRSLHRLSRGCAFHHNDIEHGLRC